MRTLLTFSFLLSSLAAFASEKSSAPSAVQVEAGKTIYTKGLGRGEVAIQAVMGDQGLEIPASILKCVNCHGRDGRGRAEGGVVPSNIRWSELSKPYGAKTKSGRKRPAYTENLVLRAVTMGVDSAGNQLDATNMPKYRLNHEQGRDLIAYLKVLGTIPDPGVTTKQITVGVLLPPAGPGSTAHRAIKHVVGGFFGEINRGGGIYGREIRVRFAEASGKDSLGLFVAKEQPFALLASYVAGFEDEFYSYAKKHELPIVGAIGSYPAQGFPLNRYVFHLYSGIAGQASALAKFGESLEDTGKLRYVVVHHDDERVSKVAKDLVARLKEEKRDARMIEVSETGSLPWDDMEALIWLAPDDKLADFFAATANLEKPPYLLAPSSSAGRRLFEAPDSFSGRLYVAFPILPSDQTLAGRREMMRMDPEGKAVKGSLAMTLTALSSARLLVHAMTESGKEVSREAVVDALEKLSGFQTGHSRSMTFGPNRRIGSIGAHVLPVDLAKGKLVLPGRWIDLK